MPSPTLHALTRTALGLSPRSLWLWAASLVLLVLALLPGEGAWLRQPLLTAALALAVTGGLLRCSIRAQALRQRALARQIDTILGSDPAPVFVSSRAGGLIYANGAARARLGLAALPPPGPAGPGPLTQALAGFFAAPGAELRRLSDLALAQGQARAEAQGRRGRVALLVHRIQDDTLLWRLVDLADGAAGQADLADLAEGPVPQLVQGPGGQVLAMNGAMRRLLGAGHWGGGLALGGPPGDRSRPDRPRSLARLFGGTEVLPGQIAEVQGPSGRRAVLPIEVAAPMGRRALYLLPPESLGAHLAGLGPPSDPAAFETLPVALLRLSAAGEVLAANHAARNLLGQVEIGAPFAQAMEGLGRPVADWLADVARGRGERRPEVLRARRAARETYLQVTLARVLRPEGGELVAVLQDATQLKSLEAQFAQSQKMQAIGQLAGGVAHDFNNLLTAISGHCDLLLLRHDPGDPDYADLVQIHQNANRAAALVSQLLAFSRKQTLQPRVLDLRDTLSEMGHLLNRLLGERIRLDLTHDPGLRPIRADRRQLEQVLMNLVVNARDAMPDGGTVRIATVNERLEQPNHRDRVTLPAGDYVVLRISDEGIGIAPDLLGKIFEPFFTTKRAGEGTGLGLSTVYGIVKQTGGYIFVDSVEGLGSVFTLWFPALPADAVDEPELAPIAHATGAPEPRVTGGVVLLVEDEAPVRAFASRALRLRGFSVLEADCGEEALRLLEDPELPVDVFVTDVVMPGLDGPSWVRQALVQRPDVRVVFVSGYAEEAVQDSQARIARSVFLPKPFSLADLVATVRAQMPQPDSDAAPRPSGRGGDATATSGPTATAGPIPGPTAGTAFSAATLGGAHLP